MCKNNAVNTVKRLRNLCNLSEFCSPLFMHTDMFAEGVASAQSHLMIPMATFVLQDIAALSAQPVKYPVSLALTVQHPGLHSV